MISGELQLIRELTDRFETLVISPSPTHFDPSSANMVLHNPNNWHWVNKDVSAWTQEYLENDLTGISAEADGVTAKVDKVISMDGDVDVSQRKGKVITLFDVKLKLEYSGKPVLTISLGSPSISHPPRLRIDNILVGNFVPLLFISSILRGPEFCC
jgi:hypothetical protein